MTWDKICLNKSDRKINVIAIFSIVFIISNPIMIFNLNGNGIIGLEDNDNLSKKIKYQHPQILDNEPPDAIDPLFINTIDETAPLLPSPTNGSFQYPKGSTVIPMGNAQDENQRRMLYKELFSRIYSSGGVELIMDNFISDSIEYPAGTLASMTGFGGHFNYTYATEPFNISRGYSLHPRKIAIFKSDVLDGYQQNVTWEEGYFERIFRVYLWGDYFDRINETGIRNNDLMDYDVLILPSIIKGYEKSVSKELGIKGLNKLREFVRKGNVLYAQGSACYLAEEALLVPNGTVLLDKRIEANNSHADMAVVNNSYPLSQSWLSDKMYVIDDPVLNVTDPDAVIAKYTGNITNSSLINTSAIMVFKAHKGEVILTNGHPSVNSDFYPIFFDAMFYAMAETSDLRARAKQIYNPELPPNLIPAQEADVPVQVDIEYINFWPNLNNSPKTVELNEIISPWFYLDKNNITPTPGNITRRNATYGGYGIGNSTENESEPPLGNIETVVTWNFNDTQGIHNFSLIVKTFENTTKKGIVPVSWGYAKFTPPNFLGRDEITHGWTYVQAALAANLVGDRDIELDGCYPLRSTGEYFDIALTLENKEETTAKNITVIDIVCLKSPIVDVQNQSRVPGAWNNTNNGTNNSIFAINEIFFYFDEFNHSLYPLPDEIYNTTYNYTFGNNDTNITLPAKKLVWHIEDLLAYDYLEPAIRYGIFTHEEFNRTVSFLSDPVKGGVILNASGGSVFTNLGTHPVPYHEYLSHGVVTIPKGEEIPRVEYKDIWNRNHTMSLRTVFYDIVPFPPPEEHMVVTTTFEMTYEGERLKEFPIHHDVDLYFKLKSWNGYGKYDPYKYPYHMNITKNETMIVQAIPRGVGYNIEYINASFNKNTSLLMIHNTSTHSILYFQQDIAGGHKEEIEINAELSGYPTVHREGSMKINDGARFVYHQIAVGPSRYEVFDSHVQAVFAIGNDVTVEKKVAPVYIATFGDDVYHFIELEDPYEPREFMEDPYIKSYGFGDMAATTYVGGRINETIFHSRVDPGGRTLIRLEVDNNLGYDLNNVTITPVAPEGFKVTADNFTTQIPPIFFDFPFINRTDIWDAWKAVYYFWVDINETVEGGKVYEINFTFKSNCTNATYLPTDFEIPPALIGVKDSSGHVEAIFGRAINLTLSDTVPSNIVRPEDVRIANVDEKTALELMLATGVAAPGKYNRSIVNQSYQTLRGINFTSGGGGKYDINLPPYAQMMPWLDNNTNRKTLYVIVRTNVTVKKGGAYVVNKGPAVSYVNHFNETVNISGNNEYIEAHGPAFNYKMSVMSIQCDNIDQSYLTGGMNNTVRTRVTCLNWGDDIASSSTAQVQLPPTILLSYATLPGNTKVIGNTIYWTLGDIGPGSEKSMDFEFFTTPPDINKTPNRGPPDPWLLIEQAQVKFIHGYLRKPVAAEPSESLFGYLYDSDLALTEISYSHPFAATNTTHSIFAHVKNNWMFTNTVFDIMVNFSVNGVYAGTGMIPSLSSGETVRCGINIVLQKEGIYKIKAVIVGPQLNEFYDTNNELECSLIAVDPVTVMTQPDFGTGTDSFISELDAKLTFGNEYNLKVGRVSSAGGYGSGIGVSCGLIKVDMSGIPKNAIILDAELQLYMYKSTGGDLKISTHQVLSTWTEDITTWNTQPVYNTTALDSISIDSIVGYKSWNVTSTVITWVADPARNFGIILKSDYETWGRWKEFYSSDSENNLRPKLKIKYAMLKNTPNILTSELTVGDYKDKELRLLWKPVPYSLYYEIYRAEQPNGPYTKLGTTWDTSDTTAQGSLNTFFYDDVDGGYPEPLTVISTDRGGLPGTIRVFWTPPAAPAPSPVYYYRIKAIGVEDRNSKLIDSPTVEGQLTPIISKYQIFNSTSSTGPWNKMLVETMENTYSHSGLGVGKYMYYRIKSETSEGYQSGLSKVVWGRSNYPPQVSDIYISPSTAYTTDYLEAKYTFTDTDGDLESGTRIRWYRDGNLFPSYNSKIYPSWTAKNQVWYFTVTPKDGIEFGTGGSSGVITIQNLPPVLSNVKILPTHPTTTENLTLNYQYSDADKDPKTITEIVWFKDSVHQSAYDGLTSIPSSATVKNEIWNVSIRVSDGTDYCLWVKPDAIKVWNSLPEVSEVKISPENPKTNDTMEAIYTYSDADSDLENGSLIYWYKNNNLQSSLNNKLKVPNTATGKGEQWYFTITPKDGEQYGTKVKSTTVKIENSAPEISKLKLNPENPATDDVLWISYQYFDIDGDSENSPTIKWYCNDKYISELDYYYQVPFSYTIRGQQWKAQVIPYDGFNYGSTYYTNSVEIQNTPSQVISAYIEPNSPALADDLIVKYDYYDPDDDDISELHIKWFKNSQEQIELLDKETVESKYTNSNEIWNFEIQVFDGFVYSPSFESISVKINTPPMVTNVFITPQNPTTIDDLTANYEWSDLDAKDVENGTLIQWYQNNKMRDDLTNSVIVPAKFTKKGDNWYFSITPYDGKDIGVITKSEVIKIKNSPPSASNLTILPEHPVADSELIAQYQFYDIDNDVELGSIVKWYRNNELIEDLIGSNGVQKHWLEKDDIWYFSIQPRDGKAFGEIIISPEIKIENSAPIITSATISPELPTTEDSLQPIIEFNDLDANDKLKVEYKWFKNQLIQHELTGENSVPATETKRGESWYYTARIFDGVSWSALMTSDSVVIQNTVPEINDILITPTQPISTEVLKVQYDYSDLDGDIETGSEVRWFRDEQLVEELNDEIEVPVDMLNMGEQWYCKVRPSDGFGFGELVQAWKVKINTVPEIVGMKINPANPTSGDFLKVVYEYYDVDNDEEGDSIIRWYKNGIYVTDEQNEIPGRAVKPGDKWYVIVQPHDGKELGKEYQSYEVQIPELDDETPEASKRYITEDVSNYSGYIISLIILLIIIIISIILLVSFKNRKKQVQIEKTINHLAKNYHMDKSDTEALDVNEFQNKYEIKPDKYTPTKQLHEPNVVKTPQNQELLESLSYVSPYKDIDLEFKCPKCNAEIDFGDEQCKFCGEEFGSL